MFHEVLDRVGDNEALRLKIIIKLAKIYIAICNHFKSREYLKAAKLLMI